MFVGGTAAPAAVVVWAMSELMRNPEVMEKAQSEVRKVFNEKGYVDEEELGKCEYLNSVMKETMRLHPPEALLVPRENSKVIINAWAIGMKQRYLWRRDLLRVLMISVALSLNTSLLGLEGEFVQELHFLCVTCCCYWPISFTIFFGSCHMEPHIKHSTCPSPLALLLEEQMIFA
ncbi:hypothetical protein V8G54_004099 [Vigna mungo]|uniref:Uncharacterized protein n=1 Tax=Vigna mungo TaxID=3915 RepID=A0AAQ3PDJ4_VIGMU